MLLKYFFIVAMSFFVASCKEQPSFSQHTSLINPTLWSYGHDPYGSSVEMGDNLVQDGAVRIIFHRAPQVSPDKNTWVELIYKTPEENLEKVKAIKITYQCSTAVTVKFSQRDFGELGDGSYAHYQTTVPAADDWKTMEIALQNFSRPAWTPASSKDVGLIMENVSAIYFAPAIDDIHGGFAS